MHCLRLVVKLLLFNQYQKTRVETRGFFLAQKSNPQRNRSSYNLDIDLPEAKRPAEAGLFFIEKFPDK